MNSVARLNMFASPHHRLCVQVLDSFSYITVMFQEGFAVRQGHLAPPSFTPDSPRPKNAGEGLLYFNSDYSNLCFFPFQRRQNIHHFTAYLMTFTVNNIQSDNCTLLCQQVLTLTSSCANNVLFLLFIFCFSDSTNGPTLTIPVEKMAKDSSNVNRK